MSLSKKSRQNTFNLWRESDFYPQCEEQPPLQPYLNEFSIKSGDYKQNTTEKQQDELLAKKSKIHSGETKNVPKNFCRALKACICTEFSQEQIERNIDLCTFVSKTQKQGQKELNSFLGTEIGRNVGDMFFGNLKFASYFIKKNKVDLDLYFRVRDDYFLSNARLGKQQNGNDQQKTSNDNENQFKDGERIELNSEFNNRVELVYFDWEESISQESSSEESSSEESSSDREYFSLNNINRFLNMNYMSEFNDPVIEEEESNIYQNENNEMIIHNQINQ